MKFKAVFFDVDNTLYDSTLQVAMARQNAVRAMIEAGLPREEEEALKALEGIVQKHGSNYPNHLNRLIEKFNLPEDPHWIAAGVVAYHNTKTGYLTPYADTVPTLIALRDRGIKLGVITDGVPVKQWEKLIRLGLHHFFDAVVISGSVGIEKPAVKPFEEALARTKVKPKEALMVGDRLDKDVEGAHAAGLYAAQIVQGKHSDKKPANTLQEPDYLISRLRDVLSITENP
ncbi:Glyceraldehyde 3-phosphate phosphatase [uncultured archaeon]|nr:Glyceraldehyde 3-phosphate phosphatase [uncultured archaeon]